MHRTLTRFSAALLLTALPAMAALNLPPLTGRVVDLANVLSPATEAALTEQLAAHEQRTSNQLVVATVPSLQGYDIERFAVELFRAWGLGQKDRNNGVLLLVAPNEREVRIEVGYGLEGTLTDALSADIIQNRILPRFRAGDIPGGIAGGVDAILAVIEGTYQPIATPPSGSDQFQALVANPLAHCVTDLSARKTSSQRFHFRTHDPVLTHALLRSTKANRWHRAKRNCASKQFQFDCIPTLKKFHNARNFPPSRTGSVRFRTYSTTSKYCSSSLKRRW